MTTMIQRASLMLTGAAAAVVLVGCVAATQAEPDEVVQTVGPEPIVEVTEVTGTEPEPPTADDETADVVVNEDPAPAPEEEYQPQLPDEVVPTLDCVHDPAIECDDPADEGGELIPPHVEPFNPEVPPVPAGVHVYFSTYEDTYPLIDAGVPCWEDYEGRSVCWIQGAVGAEVQVGD